MEVGEFDRVADQLDLVAQAADLVVVDVRDLFEDEFLDLALGHHFVDVAGPGFQQERIAGADGDVQQRLGEPHHPFLVGVPDHQGALAVLEDLLEGDDVPGALELHGLDHVERFVEHDFLAAPQFVGLDAGADVHPELAAPGEDVDGAVLVGLQEDSEAGRRLREPVDLLLEGHDLVAGLAERVGEPLVLARTRPPGWSAARRSALRESSYDAASRRAYVAGRRFPALDRQPGRLGPRTPARAGCRGCCRRRGLPRSSPPPRGAGRFLTLPGLVVIETPKKITKTLRCV